MVYRKKKDPRTLRRIRTPIAQAAPQTTDPRAGSRALDSQAGPQAQDSLAGPKDIGHMLESVINNG